MFGPFARAALAASLVVAAVPSQAALIYDYQLNGDYSDALGNPDAAGNGGSIEPTGYAFPAGEGLSITLSTPLSVYTIETAFSFEEVSGYRRIVDFKDLTSDTGFYVYNSQLNFYPLVTDGPVIAPNDFIIVTISRNAAGLVEATLNGTSVWTFDDSAGLAELDQGVLHLFIDDMVIPNETSAGFVDYVRIYDTAGTSQPAVPEPASWAMMIAGLGAVGLAMRRRRASVRFA